MEARTLSWGLTAGAFVLLLTFSTWHGAWWRAAAAPVARDQSYKGNFVPETLPSNPFAATSEFVPTPQAEAAPTAPATNPTAVGARAEPRQSGQQSDDATPEAEANYEAMAVQRNRGVEHGARAH